jgi:hypothetical protein
VLVVRKGYGVEALGGGKVSTQERRGWTLGERDFRRIGAFIISAATSPTQRSLPRHPVVARISSTTESMSQPVVQTIHRDPALLYVGAREHGSMDH